MTDKRLKLLIEKLNNRKTNGLFHLRPLAPTVDFTKVWISKPMPTDSICYPDGPQDFISSKMKVAFTLPLF